MFADDWTPSELPERNTLAPFLTRNGVTRARVTLGYRLLHETRTVQVLLAVLVVAAALWLAAVAF